MSGGGGGFAHLALGGVREQIALLEAEAGFPLIERRGRRVRLTQAGQRLVAHAEHVIAVLEEAKPNWPSWSRRSPANCGSRLLVVAAALIPRP